MGLIARCTKSIRPDIRLLDDHAEALRFLLDAREEALDLIGLQVIGLHGHAADRPSFQATVCRTFSTRPYQVFLMPQGMLFLELKNKPGSAKDNNGAVVALDYQTGELIAYVGSANYNAPKSTKQFQAKFDVVGSGFRQPGSAFTLTATSLPEGTAPSTDSVLVSSQRVRSEPRSSAASSVES